MLFVVVRPVSALVVLSVVVRMVSDFVACCLWVVGAVICLCTVMLSGVVGTVSVAAVLCAGCQNGECLYTVMLPLSCWNSD